MYLDSGARLEILALKRIERFGKIEERRNSPFQMLPYDASLQDQNLFFE